MSLPWAVRPTDPSPTELGKTIPINPKRIKKSKHVLYNIQYVLSNEHGNFSGLGISNMKQKVDFEWRNMGRIVPC